MSSGVGRKPRILVFCRPYLVPDFRANVAPVLDEFDVEFLTDGRAPGTRDTRSAFYARLRRAERCPELDAATEVDVRSRCRLLRNLPEETALNLMHAMACVLVEELDRIAPRAILCHQVDEYITHLLCVLGARRGIRFIGYAQSYFPSLVQVMQHAHGEAIDVREPDDAEVEAVHERIAQRSFRQNYAQRGNYTIAQHVKGIARYAVKRLVFGAKSILERDPWNLHYAVTPYIVERRRLRDFPRQRHFANNWQAELERLKSESARRVVYLPLAYFPESTVDYWVRDRRILDYERVTLETIRALARRHIVIVKEHLHMMGGRDAAFYRQLISEPGVVSVHPMEYSNDVLAASDAVVVGGGSVGVEATIRGKPVLTYCDTSYWFRPSGATLLSLRDIPSWSRYVDEALARHRPLGPDEVREFLRACLRSTVRPRPGGRRWPLIEATQLRMLLRAGLAETTQGTVRSPQRTEGVAC